MLTGSDDGVANIWDANSGNKLQSFHNSVGDHIDFVLDFSPDGLKVSTSLYQKTTIWNSVTGKLLHVLEHADKSTIYRAEFSPDGMKIATHARTKSTGRMIIWDVATGKAIRKHQSNKVNFSKSIFSPNGKVYLVLRGRTVDLRNIHTGERLKSFVNNRGEEFDTVQFSPDGFGLLTVNDNTASVWDISTGKILWFYYHGSFIGDSDFSPDGEKIITGSFDKTAKLWDVRRKILHKKNIYFSTYDKNGEKIITTSEDGLVILWDAKTRKKIQIFEINEPIRYASFNIDETRVIIASETKISLWEIETGEKIQEFADKGRFYKSFSSPLSPDRNKVILFHKGKPSLWDIELGTKLKDFYNFDGHNYYVHSYFSPDGKFLLTARKKAILWDIETGKSFRVLEHQSAGIISAMFSPDGLKVVTNFDDKSTGIWDIVTGKLLRVWQHKNTMNHADFSPDGEKVITTSVTSRLKKVTLWDTESGQHLHDFHHDDKIDGYTFNFDGSMLMTFSNAHPNYYITLWDVDTGEVLQFYKFDHWIHHVAFNPNGQEIVASLENGEAALLHIIPSKLANHIIKLLPDNRKCLSPVERKKFFLPELANEQWGERGCIRYATDIE